MIQRSDGILILLVAKLVCCGLLGLAAAGLLGGAIGWLFGPGFWIVAVTFAAAMGLIVLFPPRSRTPGQSSELGRRAPGEKVNR